MSTLKDYAHSLLNLFYPHLCRACGHELYQLDQYVCWRCQRDLPYTAFEQFAENPVRKLFTGRLPIEQGSSLLFFSKLSITQALVHQFKYKDEQDLGLWMGRLMGSRLKEQPHYAGIDCLVPLPLNVRKLRQRGFNQAEVLARGMSESMQLPVAPVAVLRTQYTSTQTRKSRLQRWLNVEHVFGIAKDSGLEGKHVLLVDDVITTGATMDACGHALLKIPGLKLSVCSLAYASR